MPEHTPATRILRDDLLAQLRAASRPMSTTELRRNAPKVPVNGLRTLVAPIREQIYRVLCALHHDGLVTRDTGQGRGVIWAPAPGAADEEIAALAEALRPACTEPAHGPSTALCIAAAHLKAARPRHRHYRRQRSSYHRAQRGRHQLGRRLDRRQPPPRRRRPRSPHRRGDLGDDEHDGAAAVARPARDR